MHVKASLIDKPPQGWRHLSHKLRHPLAITKTSAQVKSCRHSTTANDCMPGVSFTGAKKRKIRHFRPLFRMQRPDTSSTATAPSRLLSLVDELLLNIIDHVDSCATLCNLAATCPRLQSIVEPYIWRNLLVTKGEQALGIGKALDAREERTSYIQDLSVRYNAQHEYGIEELNHHMLYMTELKHLHIESPCPNNVEWQSGLHFDNATRISYTSLLERAAFPLDSQKTLPMLQTLTLHGHGGDRQKFVFGRTAAVFFHPTLRNITISCADFDADIGRDDIPAEKLKSSPLRSLTLIECNVNVHFLQLVLGFPKALKELDIGERQYVFDDAVPSPNPDLRTSSPLFLEALQQQADSLERLVHVCGSTEHVPPLIVDENGSAKLRSLKRLQHLDLGMESHLLYYLRKNGCPESLKTLRLTNAAWNRHGLSNGGVKRVLSECADLLTYHLSESIDVDIVFSNLTLLFRTVFLISVAIHRHAPEEDLYDELIHELFDDREPIYRSALQLKTRNCRFRIFREYFKSGRSFIPPYMFGEELPTEKLMYDSQDFWRFAGRDYQLVDDENFREEMRRKESRLRCESCKAGEKECANWGDGSECYACKMGRVVCVYSPGEMARVEANI